MTELLEACFTFLGEGALDCWLEIRQRNLKPGDMWIKEFSEDYGVSTEEIRAILAPPPAPEDLRLAVAQLTGILLQQVEQEEAGIASKEV